MNPIFIRVNFKSTCKRHLTGVKIDPDENGVKINSDEKGVQIWVQIYLDENGVQMDSDKTPFWG